MTFNVYNTHMELNPYKKGDYPEIEELYTSIDPFTQEFVPCGYIIENNTLFIPRGTPIDYIEKVTKTRARYSRKSDPSSDMNIKHYPTVEPRDEVQQKTIEFLMQPDKQLSVNLLTGMGKGLPLDTLIPTPHGWVTMNDIEIGDQIFGSDGKPYNVIGVYPQGMQDIYEITFSDGRKVKCDENHLWLVEENYSNPKGMRSVISTKELIKTYKIYSPTLKMRGVENPYSFKYRIPLLSKPVEYEPREVPIDPYVLGAFIGSGGLTESFLSITSDSDYLPHEIGMICGFHVRPPHDNSKVYTFRYKNGKPVYTKDFFKAFPNLVTQKSNKVIPYCYMCNSVDVRRRLLQGLMDSNGTIAANPNKPDMCYSSTSKVLLEQIQELIRGFGFIATVGVGRNGSRNDLHGYQGRVHIRVPNWFKVELFIVPKKKELAIRAERYGKPVTQKYNHIVIHNIEKVGRAHTKCIKVDSPDELFLCDEFIVTHNTFVTAYSSMKLNKKTIIITPSDTLKRQWIKTYEDMMDIGSDQMLDISSSDMMKAINNGKIDPAPIDVFFVNHQTLRSFFLRYGPRAFTTFFRKIKVGIKVYDEAHKEFHNILLIDDYTNTDRTWYLTATFDRSEKSESRCFRLAFSSVYQFGNEESRKIIPPHTIYHTVNINSQISVSNRKKVMGWNGMSVSSYGKYEFSDNPKDTVTNTIVELIGKVNNVEGKILVLVPLIDAVDKVYDTIQKKFPDNTVSRYHSKVPRDEKSEAFDADIIVSTLKSCGTGKDIKGLRTVINAEPLASKINAEQMIGRLRPYIDKDGNQLDTLFFDIVDTCIPPVVWWWKARFKRIKNIVKKVVTLDR